MARPSSAIGMEVAARAKSLDSYLGRLERLYANGQLSLQDLQRAYSGAFIHFFTFTERALERLFLGHLMCRLTTTHKGVRPLIACKSDAVARAIIGGQRRFADWLPYQHTENRAKCFLSQGKPFSSLNANQKQHFDILSILRNALAHDSAHAHKQFRKRLIDGRSLPSRDHKPPNYLRGLHAVGQTRLNYILSEVVLVMQSLCR